jgi:osmotically inducible lipoprotein OsmB
MKKLRPTAQLFLFPPYSHTPLAPSRAEVRLSKVRVSSDAALIPRRKVMKITTTIATLACCAALLSACGESKGDRALSGAGLGAGAGAVAGAVTGGSATQGAIIGGALGAAGGALTDRNDVNFGKPVWR